MVVRAQGDGTSIRDTVDNATTDTLKAFITRHVTPGVTVTFDTYKAYGFLVWDYPYTPVNKKHQTNDDDVLPQFILLSPI